MKSAEAIVIGGGQAGLAMSHALTSRGIEHVVLERGRVAERWRSERWESLNMLTPRWMSRLPGWSYKGPDPDGFMSRNELIDYLGDYAESFQAPVETGVNVTSVVRDAQGYRVETSRGDWWAPTAVIATGHCDLPRVPEFAARLDGGTLQIVPSNYRRPELLPRGGVLVVGASSTGVQLAAEIQASGRQVTLAVGRHSRLPRRYRGSDIMGWFNAMGVMNERADDVPNIRSSRRAPSLQLVGRADHQSIDLGTLQDAGVRLAGRMVDMDRRSARFADDLGEHVTVAERRLTDQLGRVDAHIRSHGLDGAVPAAGPRRPIPVPSTPAQLDLPAHDIQTVIWATGYRRSYPWLKVPVLDAHGDFRHQAGVTPAPGLYAIGLFFQTRRNSSLIDGVGLDARHLAEHVEAHLSRRVVSAA